MAFNEDILQQCETRIQYVFRDRALLRRCLTHSSSAETRLDSNERLEFLGDAVLGLLICEHLFQLYPDQREGQLTQMKSWLVSRQTCARVARRLELEPLIFVGRGLQTIPDSILSAVVESLVAGVYFDGGLDGARTFILMAFQEELKLCQPVDTENFKSQLQEYTQRELSRTPEYVVIEESGPDHAREFVIAARVGELLFESGRGRSKKEAEQQAARNALLELLHPRAQAVVNTAGEVPESETDGRDVFLTLRPVGVDVQADSGQGAIPELELSFVGTGIGEVNSRSTLAGGVRRADDQKESLVKTDMAELLWNPGTEALRFLPEGPYQLGGGRFSWVAIQHGAEARFGSLNVFDLNSGHNQTWELPGRPGFAFPTETPGVFVVGLERTVGIFDTRDSSWRPFIEGIEHDVDNTIINDAVVFEDNLIFGCKELEFKTPKAGLYLWRRSDGRTIRLDREQICSNGKAVVRNSDGTLTLYDIDSCTRRIVRRLLSIEAGELGAAETVVDLTAEEIFPDGMILTPDGQSLIVALYNPGDPVAGEARQYGLQDGELQAVWKCSGSPRVTCPQLVEQAGRIRLVLTTAVEHMSVEQAGRHPSAGCLFIADTGFSSSGDQPTFRTPFPG